MNNWFHFTNKTEQPNCVQNSGFVPCRSVPVSAYVFMHLCYLCHSHAHNVLSITTFHRRLSPWFGTFMALNTVNTCSAYFTQRRTRRKIRGNKLLRGIHRDIETETETQNGKKRMMTMMMKKQNNTRKYMHCMSISEMVSIFWPVEISRFREHDSNLCIPFCFWKKRLEFQTNE